ncbi:hypothetical protein B0H65DRAFT_458175 [Neurospora tetraspora]|uniref:Uncharacterized protein n=1 Tax=Neurospora tetraspora TaxID=94610 RepID=A0AAE0MV84_9PEZI|nr:hypothetical protein B0H65DRAFT_458175 [Neurospora tetraspora]
MLVQVLLVGCHEELLDVWFDTLPAPARICDTQNTKVDNNRVPESLWACSTYRHGTCEVVQDIRADGLHQRPLPFSCEPTSPPLDICDNSNGIEAVSFWPVIFLDAPRITHMVP